MVRALVLSGGGSKGAFQVGALKYLVGDRRCTYDVLCGVSVGAINTAHIAQYARGTEKQSVVDLEKLWLDLTTRKVRKDWSPFGKLMALTRPSLYNSHPLRQFLESHLSIDKIRKSGRRLRLGVVSLNSGKYALFSEITKDLLGAVLASSSFPAMLLPIEIEGDLWTDGGVRHVTPLSAALDLGVDEVDVVMTSPEDPEFKPLHCPNALEVAYRAIDIMSCEIIQDDIDKALLWNKLAKLGKGEGKRYVPIHIIRPEHPLEVDSLTFEPSSTQCMIDLGYAAAKKQAAAVVS